MKKTLMLIFTFLLILTSTACSTDAVNQNGETSSIVIEEITDLTSLDKSILDSFDNLKQQRGYHLFDASENQNILLISLGEKRTAGYDIVNPVVKVKDNTVNVTIEEIMPDGMAAQVITYPYKAFYLKGKLDGLDLIVKNTVGDKFIETNEKKGNDDSNLEKTLSTSGVFIGEIDNHSIEVGINKETKAFDITNVKDQFNALKVKDMDLIQIEYEVKNGQSLVKNISKVTSAPSNLTSRVEAIFIGLADPTSFEAKVGDEVMFFQVPDGVDKFSSLNMKENDKIIITFTVDRNNQKIVSDITKK